MYLSVNQWDRWILAYKNRIFPPLFALGRKYAILICINMHFDNLTSFMPPHFFYLYSFIKYFSHLIYGTIFPL